LSKSLIGLGELAPSELAPEVELSTLGFQTTSELEPLEEVFGQDRPLRALGLGLAIRERGYNIYDSGVSGTASREKRS
jgi:hypothetical protein